MKSLLASNPFIAALMIAGSTQFASAAAVSFEGFSYTGSVTQYANQAAFDAGVAGATTTIATATDGGRSTLENARDAQIYADTNTNYFYFSTLWYYAPDESAAYGVGNPNNTSDGYVQAYDPSGSSLNNLDIFWNADGTTFTVDASGEALGGSSRLWNPAAANGDAAFTKGTFLNYDFDFIAQFANPSAYPTISGGFKGLFANNDGSIFAFDLIFQDGSSAKAGNYFYDRKDFATGGANYFDAPVPAAVPVPAALPLLGAGVAALGFLRRRRAQNR